MHGSKSISQRYILLSAFTNIPLTLSNRSYSDDEDVAISIARSCGSDVTLTGDRIIMKPSFRCADSIDVRESATSFRLTLGLLATLKCKTTIRMDPSLAARPHNDLLGSLRDFGGQIDWSSDGSLTVDFSMMTVVPYAVSGSTSSQFVSSAILMNALSGRESEVRSSYAISSSGYVDLTIQVLRDFGFSVEKSDGEFSIGRISEPTRIWVDLEGDYSSASFLIALGVLASNSGIKIENLPEHSKQPDAVFVELLRNAGADVQFVGDGLVAVKSSPSRFAIDVNSTPDLAVPASVIGIFSRDGVLLRNCRRLEIKESDRLKSIIELASSFGAVTEREGNDLFIRSSSGMRNETMLFRDHRMIMAEAIASVASGTRFPIENTRMVAKSYKNFFEDLARIGVKVDERKDND